MNEKREEDLMANTKGKKNTKKFNVKPLIGLAVIVLILLAFLLYSHMMNKVNKSAPGQVGNTAGNLYNGGLFCERDGKIYFSNPDDNYTLYSMNTDLTGLKKLYNDYARYINADENYVYYTRMNNKKEVSTQSAFTFYSTGVYRITQNGKRIKAISSDPCGALLLYDNKLYYQTYNNKSKMFTIDRTDIDGQNNMKLLAEAVLVLSAYDGKVYYSGQEKDQNIHAIDETGNESVFMEMKAYLPIVTKDGVFYVSTADGYKLYLTTLTGSDTKCIVESPVSWYNITSDGRFVFYTSDDKKNSGIFCYDRNLDTTERIAEGNYKWINLAGGYCFFFDFSNEQAYAYNYEKKVLNFFNPSKK